MKFKDASKSLEQDQKYLRFKEGATRVRIVSEPVEVWKEFHRGEGHADVYLTWEEARKHKDAKRRFCMYVLNRENGLMQIMECGTSIMQALGSYSMSEDYKFEDLPPYDITITRTGQLLDTEYTTVPARQNTELTDAEKLYIKQFEPLWNVIAKDAVDVLKDKDGNVIPF